MITQTICLPRDQIMSNGAAHELHYNVFVIGSAGLQFAKDAASLGAKVALSQGDKKWGADENVVRALHHVAITGDNMGNQIEAGWGQAEKPKSNWKLVQHNTTMLINAIHGTFLSQLKQHNIDYYPSAVSFVDAHKLLVIFVKLTA